MTAIGAARRFRSHRTALIGSVIAGFISLMAAFAPALCSLLGVDPTTTDTKVLDKVGLPAGPFGGMSWRHPLGVEPGTGRDVLARLVYGARVSLVVAFCLTFLTAVLGVLFGLLGGYRRGFLDALLGRIGDVVLAFPSFLLIIAMTHSGTERMEAIGFPAGNPSRLAYIVIATVLFGWVAIFRLVRSQVLELSQREFIEAARAANAPTRHIIAREILPNVWGQVIAATSLLFAAYIGYEAGLSFLGVGIIPPTPSWGTTLADSVRYYRTDPTYFVVPGTALFLLVFAFYLVGEGVRDAMDPRTDRSTFI